MIKLKLKLTESNAGAMDMLVEALIPLNIKFKTTSIAEISKDGEKGTIKFPKKELYGEIIFEISKSMEKNIKDIITLINTTIDEKDVTDSVFELKYDYVKSVFGRNKKIFNDLNKLFKTAGIAKVGYNNTVSDNLQTFCDENITLIFSPFNKNGRNTPFDTKLFTQYEMLSGYTELEYRGEKITKIDDEKEEIIKLGGLEVGRYYRDRNLIYIWTNIFKTNIYASLLSLKNNEFIHKYINDILKAIKDLKIKKEDVFKFTLRLLLDTFKKESTKIISENESKLSDVERNIQDYDKQLTDFYEQRIALRDTLEALKNDSGKNLFDEIAKLKKNPLVTLVELKEGKIFITFKETSIKCSLKRGDDIDHGIREMYLGKITFAISGNNKIHVTSNVPGLEGHPHPHANESGEPCFGSGDGKRKINKLFGERKFDELAYVLWMWVKTYRSSDAYVHVYNWYDDRLKQGYPVFDVKRKRIKINDEGKIKTGEQLKLVEEKNYAKNIKTYKYVTPEGK